jgi:Protein of unknown function (DUF3040)
LPHIHPSRTLRDRTLWRNTVPLSEEELRLLEQMERALVEEDPKFASTLRGTSLRRSARRRAIAAGVVFVLGIGLLMGGVMSGKGALGFAIGIGGFVVMLGSATVALTAIRGQQQASAPVDPRTASHPSRGFTVIDGGRTGRIRRPRVRSGGSGSFMERMEERWRRRRDQGGF